MAMDARAKALLAKDAKPNVMGVRAKTHIHREFKLPGALVGRSNESKAPEESKGQAEPEMVPAAAKEATVEASAKETPVSTSTPAPALVIESKTKAKSPTKFREGTLAWFDAGNDVQSAADDYEAHPSFKTRAADIWQRYPMVLLGVVSVLALVLAALTVG